MSRRKAPSIDAKRRHMMSELELLGRGEKLLWSGKPDPQWYAFTKGWMPFIIGICFVGVAVSLLPGASDAMQSHPSAAWFEIAFLTIGSASVFSPLWYFYEAERTTYALTDRRAVVDYAGFMPQRFSVPLSRVTLIAMRPRGSGSGHLYFHHTQDPDQQFELIKTTHREGFVAVPEVHRVGQLLRNAVDTYKCSVAA
jgi:hypothetical protein